MALTVTEGKVLDFDTATFSPNAKSDEVNFRIKTNKAGPGTFVISAAIAAKKLPAVGDHLDIVHDGNHFINESIFASNYRHKGHFGNARISTVHDIAVTFETVQAGSSNAPATSNPNLGQNPLQRPIQRTVEWIQTEERITKARNVTAIGDRPADTLGPIINTAGDEIEVTQSVRTPVLVVRKNVSSWEKSVAMDFKWRSTTNQITWSTIAAGQAAFLSASIAGPLFWNDLTYYTLTVRVKVSNTPFVLELPNVGPQVIEPADPLDDDAEPTKRPPEVDGIILPFGNLAADGSHAETLEFIQYKTLTRKNYAELTQDIIDYN